MSAVIEIKNLKKSFDGFSLNNISFTLEKGYIMGFIGPNGAGKSTTIKLIMNLIKKDDGEIKIFGLDNIRYEKEVKNRIGFVYDENYFYEELTVTEMKNVISPFYKKWSDNVFNKYIREFSLPKDKKIKELSKGMKMKFAIAVALSHDAELFIMDEPTSGLDPIIRSELLDILSYLIQDENKSVFFSTHITSDLDKIADYITFINKGSIVFSCPKDDILENYGLVKGPKELINSDVRKHFIGIKEKQFGFEALTDNRQQVRRILGDGAIIDKPSLDDIMLYYARGSQNV
ncbi:MAG: ABC transporter ATP-binding protein [Clostridiaceae bacterium]|nr:ABC transporter ATP-binding protein [Clostridiaceae bacterium]